MSWLKRMLHIVPAAQIERELLVEAARNHVEHLAAAEHHQALADMYERRMNRIRGHQKSELESQ